MKSWSDLPKELLHFIFTQLEDSKDFRHCQPVCRNWGRIAQEFIYKKVKISNADRLFQFVDTLNNSPSIGSLVESLSVTDCDEEDQVYKYQTYYAQGLSYLTKLRSLDMVASSTILKILLNEINQQLSQGHVISLEKIPIPEIYGQPEGKEMETRYGEAAWALRNSLTELKICDEFDQPFIHFAKTKDPSTVLQMFPRLKNVIFHVQPYRTNASKMFTALRHCKSIESVQIRQSYTREVNDKTPIRNDDYNYILPASYPTIKRFEANGLIPNNKIIEYLTTALTNLEVLNIQFTEDQDMMDLTQETDIGVSAVACITFLKHLQRNIKMFDIANLLVFDRDVMEITTNYLDSFQFLDGSLSIRYYAPGFEQGPWLESSNWGNQSYQLKVEFADNVTYNVLPHMPLIAKYGSSLKKLCLDFANNTIIQFNPNQQRQLTGYHLEYIFEKCSTVKVLEICHWQLEHHDPGSSLNDTISAFNMRECIINDCSILTDISRRLPNLTIMGACSTTFREGSFWKMNMPYTSFDLIYWSDFTEFSIFTKVYLKIHCIAFNYTLCFCRGVAESDVEYLSNEDYRTHASCAEVDGDELFLELTCQKIDKLVLLCEGYSVIIRYPGQANQEIVGDAPQEQTDLLLYELMRVEVD